MPSTLWDGQPMRILVAIPNEKPSCLTKGTLAWAARAGFELRIFGSLENFVDYVKVINDINYEEYLDIRIVALVTKYDPIEYARRFHYDLVVILPDNLKRWNKTRDRDRMIIEYAADIGRVRAEFTKDNSKDIHEFDNGAVVKRV